MRSSRYCLPAILSILLAMCPSVTAQSWQPWADRIESPLVSQITQKTLDLLKEYVDLSDAQIQRVQQLYEEHQQRFAQFVSQWKPIREAWTKKLAAAETRRDKWFAQLEREKELGRVADRQREIDDRFLEQVQALLTDEQINSWFLFRRAWHREQWLRWLSLFIDDQIDLAVLLKSDSDDEKEREDLDEDVQSILNEWGRVLDPLILSAVELRIESARKYHQSHEDGWIVFSEDGLVGSLPNGSPPEIRERAEEMWTVQRRIRDHTRAYRDLLYAALAPPENEHFLRSYLRSALDRYVPTESLVFVQAVDLALEIESISEKQQEGIDTVMQMYHETTVALDKQIIAAHDRWWDRRARDEGDRREREAQLRDAINKRYDAEERSLNELQMLLDEQQRQLVHWPELKRPDPDRDLR